MSKIVKAICKAGIIDNTESKEDQKIITENLEKWKKNSSEDSNSNSAIKEIQEDLNNTQIEINNTEIEINNTEIELDLNNLGSVLEEETNKSFKSNSSFNTIKKNEITKFVEQIIPKSYSKSEVSVEKDENLIISIPV